MTTLRAESVDGIPVVCEMCGRIVVKDTVDEAEELVEGHNMRRHYEDDIAFYIEDEADIDTGKTPKGQKEKFIKEIMSYVQEG